MRLIITGVASTCTRPLPMLGAVCSSPTTSSDVPVIPGWMSTPRWYCQRAGPPLLPVVLLAVDALALPVLGALHALLVLRAGVAVGAGARLPLRRLRLATLQPAGLARGQAARLHALLDALLLVDVALHVRLHALRGSRAGVAGLRVVLLAVDIAAHLVLLAR